MIRVDPLRPQDLPEATQLHLSHLRMGLFPRLGAGFMRCYQQSFADSPYGIALVARDGDRIVGAIFGTTSNATHYRWVVRHCGWRLGLAGASALLMRPGLAIRFATTRGGRYGRAILRRLMPAASREASGEGTPLSVLSHIVTHDGARRKGVGRALVLAFGRQAAQMGARRAVLVTEEGGLGTPFFERIGATLTARRRGQDGTLVREYGLRLGDGAAYDGAYERIVGDRRGRSLVRSVRAGARAAAFARTASGGAG